MVHFTNRRLVPTDKLVMVTGRDVPAVGLGLGADYGDRLVFLLRDEFVTDDAAPLTSPRTCEPGQGTLTVHDSAPSMSIIGGEVVPSAQNAGTSNPAIYDATGYARLPGRALLARVKGVTAFGAAGLSPGVGWTSTADATSQGLYSAIVFSVNNGRFAINDRDGTNTPLTHDAAAGDTYYDIAVVLRNAGWFGFVDGKLTWISEIGNNATVFPTVYGIAANRNPFGLDYFRVRDLPGLFTTDSGIATFVDTSLASLDAFTGTADAIHDFEFTLPGSPSAGDEISLLYRQLDANNYWKAYIKRNAGNTAWDFRADSVSAGTPTNRVNATGVGTPDCIRVICEGSVNNFYTRASNVWTKRGGTITISHQNTQTSMSIVAVAGTTLTRVQSYPRSHVVYGELTRS
jgi:hypothetical protein